MNRTTWLLPLLLAALVGAGAAGCSRGFYGGAAAGAVGAGAAYEYQSHKAMEDLEKEREAGTISQEEYERRKTEIERRSLTQ